MARYKYLEFFNKNGESYNFDYDSNLEMFTGNIFIPKISSGLFESDHIFIYERILDYDSNERYAKPHIYSFNTTKNIIASWENDTNDSIKLFTTNNTNITILNQLEIELDYSSADTFIYDQKQSNLINEEYIQINVCINSDEESLYERNLLLIDLNDNHVFAKIVIYGEVIGEDSRLLTLCNNLGYFINKENKLIFSDSDIEEGNIDFRLLNIKRKEILLEGSNIFPFIGSYKGLINAINYFGFNDLTVKEVWLNININSKDYGKYKQTDVLEVFNNDVDLTNEVIDTSIYRKLNSIALVYQMFDVTTKLDKYDLPTVKEIFNITYEEVLIKLFALKNKLSKVFLPFNIDIKDIVSEGIYYAQKYKTYNTNSNLTLDIIKGIEPKISLQTTNNFIIDLRDYEELINQYEFDPYFEEDIRNRLNETVFDLGKYLLALFIKYYPNIKSIENLPDKPNIPLGCPVIIHNDTFDIQIKNINATFRNLNSDNDYYIEFEVSDPLIGDTFIIEEKYSNIKIQYYVSSPTTEDAVTEELYNLFINTLSIPWIMFTSSIVIKGGKKYLRIQAKDVNTSNVKFDYQAYDLNGDGIKGNKLKKNYITISNNYTMKTIGNENYYEIEWKIYNDDLSFYYTVRGDINYYETLSIILPKIGFYNVEILLYTTNNLVSRKIWKHYIEIKMKKSDFIGIYRRINEEKETIFDLKDVKFNEYKTISYKPFVFNETKLKDCKATFKTLSMFGLLPNVNYKDNFLYTIMNFKPDQSISFIGPYTFKAIGKNIKMKDLKYITNKWTEISADTPASFDITSINIGGVLTITDLITGKKGKHIFKTDNIKLAVDELNSNTDSVISKYVYNYVDNDLNYYPNIPSFIHVAGKYYGKNCDWLSLNYENIVLNHIELSRTYGYRFNDFQIINDFKAFTGCAYVQFSSDISRTHGKDKYQWKISNITDENFKDIYFHSNTCGFLFHKKGKYNIELMIEDGNGNKTTSNKNMIIVQ